LFFRVSKLQLFESRANLERGGVQWPARWSMTIDVDAVYEDGVLKPERPLALEEKTKVHVIIETSAPRAPVDDDDPTGWKAAREFIGMWKGGSEGENVGEEHDRYIYGRRK